MEDGAQWTEEAQASVGALVAAGFLDQDSNGLTVHD